MEYRILGRTGLRVSAISLGCEGFMNKSPEEVKADFDFAISRGINFIDIYSRMQVEQLLCRFAPAMIFVEHDRVFQETVATKVLSL